jgi:hypothetical protein
MVTAGARGSKVSQSMAADVVTGILAEEEMLLRDPDIGLGLGFAQ